MGRVRDFTFTKSKQVRLYLALKKWSLICELHIGIVLVSKLFTNLNLNPIQKIDPGLKLNPVALGLQYSRSSSSCSSSTVYFALHSFFCLIIFVSFETSHRHRNLCKTSYKAGFYLISFTTTLQLFDFQPVDFTENLRFSMKTFANSFSGCELST